MNCKKCNSEILENAKFCGKCGTKVVAEMSATSQAVKTKSKKFFLILLAVIVGFVAYGFVAKIFTGVVNFVGVIAGISSTENLKNLDSLANIIGFLGGAYVGNLVYLAIVGQGHSTGEKKKWYQTKDGSKNYFILSLIALVIVTCVVLAIYVVKDFSKTGSSTSNSLSADNSWVAYNSTENSFTVNFPNNPIHDTNSQEISGGTVKQDTYKTADSSASVAYAVNVTEYPQSMDFSDSNGTLQNSVNLSASNMGGTIISSDLATHSGYPAINYLIQGKTGTQIKGLNILVGQRLYQLITSCDAQDISKVEFEKFANSFEIK